LGGIWILKIVREYKTIKMKKFKDKTCIICNGIYTPTSGRHKCCSKECRRIHDNNLHKSYRNKNSTDTYKTCPTCGKEFIYNKHNLKYCSKDCLRIKNLKDKKEYSNRPENKKRKQEYGKIYNKKNKEHNKEYSIKYREENKEKLKIKKKEYYDKNKEKLKEYHTVTRRDYYLKYNKEYYKTYYLENKDKIIQTSVNWKRKKREEDPSARIRDNITSQILYGLKNKRKKSSFDYLEFKLNDLMLSLESKFQDGMTWDNQGSDWHIDHIKPVAAFKLIKEDGELDLEQIKLCWSLDNLQPLWAKENASKGSWYEVDGKMCRFSNGEIVEIREESA